MREGSGKMVFGAMENEELVDDWGRKSSTGLSSRVSKYLSTELSVPYASGIPTPIWKPQGGMRPFKFFSGNVNSGSIAVEQEG